MRPRTPSSLSSSLSSSRSTWSPIIGRGPSAPSKRRRAISGFERGCIPSPPRFHNKVLWRFRTSGYGDETMLRKLVHQFRYVSASRRVGSRSRGGRNKHRERGCPCRSTKRRSNAARSARRVGPSKPKRSSGGPTASAPAACGARCERCSSGGLAGGLQQVKVHGCTAAAQTVSASAAMRATSDTYTAADRSKRWRSTVATVPEPRQSVVPLIGGRQ